MHGRGLARVPSPQIIIPSHCKVEGVSLDMWHRTDLPVFCGPARWTRRRRRAVVVANHKQPDW